jgi:hypothetical protein
MQESAVRPLRRAWRASGRLIHQAIPAKRTTAAEWARPQADRWRKCAQVDGEAHAISGPSHMVRKLAPRCCVPARQLAINLAGRIPFEQAPAADQHAPDGADNGIQTEKCLVGKAGKFEGQLLGVPGKRAGHGGQCCLSKTSSGLRKNRETRPTRAEEHNAEHGSGPPPGGRQGVQPKSSRRTSAAGTRLRRRLSNSFHCASLESGLIWRCALPSGLLDGTRRRNQPVSCQSPRIQR